MAAQQHNRFCIVLVAVSKKNKARIYHIVLKHPAQAPTAAKCRAIRGTLSCELRHDGANP
jgi:hypothetical protein